jgi:hypothetical protein
MKIRPLIKAAFISRRFIKDVKDEEEVKSIVSDVLDCSNVDYYELHKFEENIDGYLIFRAKKEGTHIVYCVDREMQLFFLRAFRNYRDYERFLDDRRGIRRLVSHAFNEGENEI